MTYSEIRLPAVAAHVCVFLALSGIARAQSDDETPKQTFQRVCLDCHGMEMVDGQHYSRAVWRETVEQMVRRGAQVSDGDVQTIIDYLAATYPATKIHINTESASDLRLDLPLAPKVAAAIVHYREEHGDFKNIDDLAKVPGLDLATIKENEERFVF